MGFNFCLECLISYDQKSRNIPIDFRSISYFISSLHFRELMSQI